jgi:hypothetical protein
LLALHNSQRFQHTLTITENLVTGSQEPDLREIFLSMASDLNSSFGAYMLCMNIRAISSYHNISEKL